MVLLQTASSLLERHSAIVLALPYLRPFLAGLYPMEKVSDNEYLLPKPTNELMRLFLRVNSQNPQLDQITLVRDWKLENSTELKEGMALKKAVEQLGDKAHLFFAEFLHTLTNQPQMRIVVALDQVNGLLGHTAYRDIKGDFIPANKFAPLKALADLFFGTSTEKRGEGVSLVGCTSAWTLGKQDPFISSTDSSKQNAPVVHVERYTPKEMEAVLTYYVRAGLLPRDCMSAELVKKVQFMSAGSARDAFEFCKYQPLL